MATPAPYDPAQAGTRAAQSAVRTLDRKSVV